MSRKLHIAIGAIGQPETAAGYEARVKRTDRFEALITRGAIKLAPGSVAIRTSPTTVWILPSGRKAGRNGPTRKRGQT